VERGQKKSNRANQADHDRQYMAQAYMVQALHPIPDPQCREG
jgi:hypothetical protein